MGGSGLIVVVIVAAWALFLVPQWLHRRAEAAARLADRVDVVEPQAHAGDEAPAPQPRLRVGRRALARRTAPEPARRRWWRGPLRREHRAPARNPGPVRTAAARRRRVLAVLALATLLAATAVGVGALTGLPVPAWVVAVPGGLMVAYLVLLAVLRPGASTAAPRSTTSAPVEADDEAAAPAAVDEQPADVESAAAAPAEVAADPAPTWTPVPVPSPTYVTAPRARRVVRTIDLSNPGSWTTSRDEPAEPVVAAPAASSDPDVVEQRRAVGG